MDVQDYNTPPFQGLDGEIYQPGTVDYYVAMTEMVLHGFNVGGDPKRFFEALPANKVAVGFLTGDPQPARVDPAMQYLITGKARAGASCRLRQPSGYRDMIGAMFWTIDPDRRDNYNFSNVIGPQLHAYPVSRQALEDVLERELHLSHAPVRRSNASIVGAGDSRIRQPPRRVIQEVERLPTELQLVAFLDAKILVRGEVPVEAARTQHRIPARIAELVDRLQDKCPGVEPLVRGRMFESNGLAGRVGTVIGDVGVGAIHAVSRVDRKTGSPCDDRTELPATRDAVQEAVPDDQLPAFADRQIVQARHHQAMTIVECRKPPLASLTVTILPEQSVAVGSANAAGLVDGLRPRVRHQRGHAMREALGQLRSHRVVVPVAAVFDEDEQSEVRIGRAAGHRARSRHRRADATIRLQMMTDRSHVSGLERQVVGKLALYVDQPLHR